MPEDLPQNASQSPWFTIENKKQVARPLSIILGILYRNVVCVEADVKRSNVSIMFQT